MGSGQAINLEMFWKFQAMCQFWSLPLTVHVMYRYLVQRWHKYKLTKILPPNLLFMYVVKWFRQKFIKYIQLLVWSLSIWRILFTSIILWRIYFDSTKVVTMLQHNSIAIDFLLRGSFLLIYTHEYEQVAALQVARVWEMVMGMAVVWTHSTLSMPDWEQNWEWKHSLSSSMNTSDSFDSWMTPRGVYPCSLIIL